MDIEQEELGEALRVLVSAGAAIQPSGHYRTGGVSGPDLERALEVLAKSGVVANVAFHPRYDVPSIGPMTPERPSRAVDREHGTTRWWTYSAGLHPARHMGTSLDVTVYKESMEEVG